MTRFLTALIAAAGVFVFSVPATAQTYADLRARAECQAVGASGAEMQSCINSYKRQMFMRNLGRTLQEMGRQSQPRPTPFWLQREMYEDLRRDRSRDW